MPAVAALLLIGLISAIGGSGQRDAWMQGYLAGRLSAGGEGTADLAPYMMMRGAGPWHYGGWGAGLTCLIPLGFLALVGLLIASHKHRRRWHADASNWEERLRQEADRWHRHRRGGEASGEDQGMV
jgi:hypothetical protein